MFELRLDNDFSLIGKFETKEEAIQVMNAKIDNVLIDDSILMFDNIKLVFSRNGKKTIDKVVKMQKFTAIQVKTLSATNSKGTRVKLVTDKKSIILPYNYEFNTSLCIALDYLIKQGNEVQGLTTINNVNVILMNSNFSL